MKHGPPSKIWDYDSSLRELIAAVKRHVESSEGRKAWDTIFFSLQNSDQYPYEIRAILPGKPEARFSPTSEVDQPVQSLVQVLRAPPKTRWKALRIEIRSEGSIIELR
jgi:hypothetical protein